MPEQTVTDVLLYSFTGIAGLLLLALIGIAAARFLVIAPPAPIERAYAYARTRGRTPVRLRRGVSHSPDAVQARLRATLGTFTTADTAVLRAVRRERYSEA